MRKKLFGTYEIARICQVAPITVGRWLEEGKLPYLKTGGGHRRVWDKDLVKFLNAHNYPIPKYFKNSQSTVLIVSNLTKTKRLIRQALQRSSIQLKIHEASNGYEAGEKITSLYPNLVILDFRLPDLDGFKVCKRIRDNKELRQTKIIALTGNHAEMIKKKIIMSGADTVMEKPFDQTVLLKLVKKLGETPI